MPELHVNVPPGEVEKIREALRKLRPSDPSLRAPGATSSTSETPPRIPRKERDLVDIAAEAFAVYTWVVEQMAEGRAVVAVDESGIPKRQLVTPSVTVREPPPEPPAPNKAQADEGERPAAGSTGGPNV